MASLGNGLSPFIGINPADIESMTILKDADATSIYGSQGAYGVVLITTKRAKAGKTKFDLSASSGPEKVRGRKSTYSCLQRPTSSHSSG